ncbi:SMI1/KNR4 family protein [Olleya sp. R77988]|uniref:SMI1/KNR4 family protein n=1 Tax=Olleya sp. R77988 TaxID=3093875 RepID=UPI0037C7DA30
MNINYLNLMKNTPEIFGSKNRGISEQEISQFQEKYSIAFPKSYQEFLFLAGGYCNINVSSLDYDYESQNNVKNTLEKNNLKIEGGEFWVISELDGGEQFHFFYFNDPDAEDPENPPVYVSHPAYLDEGGDLKRKIANSFSEFIDNIINKLT